MVQCFDLFILICAYSVSETYERYEIDASSSNHINVSNEATSTVDIKPVTDSSDAFQSSKRKKVEPDSNLSEILKKTKVEYAQSSGKLLSINLSQ